MNIRAVFAPLRAAIRPPRLRGYRRAPWFLPGALSAASLAALAAAGWLHSRHVPAPAAWLWALYALIFAFTAALAALLGRRLAAAAKLEAETERHAKDLKDLNLELEALSYSISHDLRAPLRAVSGFSRILLEDYASQVDPEGLRLLKSIQIGGLKMERLIEDLLAFSRTNRAALYAAPLDARSLVESVREDLSAQIGDRAVTFNIGPLHPCSADRNLIRQVWFNVLSNAVKFTRQVERAAIEVSSRVEGPEVVYAVRDNGAGFEMQYAHKLFGVFERLHTQSEFEGTGIGLAIVRRIIHRHGGRVWAEGSPGEGAVFYFTLAALN